MTSNRTKIPAPRLERRPAKEAGENVALRNLSYNFTLKPSRWVKNALAMRSRNGFSTCRA